jgi:acetyl-CoA carboxylase biotin carboxyl carrier protein
MDLKELQAIMDLFEKSGLSELTVKRSGEEICLKKAVSGQPVTMFQSAPAAVYQTMPQAPAGAVPAQPDLKSMKDAASPAAGIEIIKAPLVGNFYRAAAPDSPPFVEKGDTIKKGQTLCILEAMKLMNEFQAEFECTIVNILVENGKMVEFGTPLFEVRRV